MTSRAMAPRVVSVDLLRLLASFQMIQGHVVGGLALPAALAGPLFAPWSFARGLTSVAFMFAAGLAFYLTTLVDLPAHLATPRASRKRFSRAALLVAIGYLLHTPIGTPLEQALIVDVLQCIGVTLACLEGLAVLLRRSARVVFASGLLAAACLATAPLAASVDASGPLRFLLNYVTRTGGSLFPLAPYAANLLVGVVAGAFSLPLGASTPRRTTCVRLAILGVLFLALHFAVASLEPRRDPQSDASYALLKLAVVVLATAVLVLLSWSLPRLPRLLEAISGETLVLYVAHLLVLYPTGVGLVHLVGPTLSLPAAIGVALGLMLLSSALAAAWHARRVRRRSGERSPAASH